MCFIRPLSGPKKCLHLKFLRAKFQTTAGSVFSRLFEQGPFETEFYKKNKQKKLYPKTEQRTNVA